MPSNGVPESPDRTRVICNVEAEMGLLGSILFDNGVLPSVRDILTGGAEEFFRGAHQMLYRVILFLADQGSGIDCITVSAELEHRNQYEAFGGIDYLTEVCASVPHQWHAKEYAAYVHEHAVKRAMIFAHEQALRDIVSNGRTAGQLFEKLAGEQNRIAGLLTDTELDIDIRPWPDAGKPELFYGVAGDIVRLIAPHTEADPMAILGQFLVAFGSLVGRSPHWRVESTRHGVNLFACVVGSTSNARKGTAWDNVKWILSRCDETWSKDQIMSGLSSGEGLIYAVRDPVTKQVKVGGDYEEREVDQGTKDKRACWVESEFGSVLACMSRESNTLNAVIRQAYDGNTLRVATKNSPNRATDAHVSIIGHITDEEIRSKLSHTDTANGFANRFMWICARRSQCLPHGGHMGGEPSFPELIQRVEDAVCFTRLEFSGETAPVCRDEPANRLWEQVYPRLSSSRPGMLGMVTTRAIAHVMRLALIYALLDREKWIRPPHLQAALAFWDYCDQSATYIFGDSLGDPDAEKLLAAIQESGKAGMTSTDIRRRVFSGHLTAEAYRAKIATLLRANLVRQTDAPDGRKAKVWVAL
jgi:hypothetical protein